MEEKMKNEILPSDYKETLFLIKQKIELAQQQAIISVNSNLLNLYWEVGNIILGKKKEQGWGAKVIDNLSRDITDFFPGIKGFSSRNLDYMTRFALTYRNYYDISEELSKVSWSHNIILMSKLKNEDERIWYMHQSIENGWSRSILNHQIEYGLYSRSATEEKVHNFPKVLPPVQSELAVQTLKDPYIFDFLTLSKDYKEKDLEEQLVKHITQFLLELGAGFAFIGRQYHLEVAGDDYYLDLLFYHLKLKCYVVIELKTVEFQPEFAR
jgi:predicted nuclease of restriction endonuclease-like (RecB) superfamily